VSELSPRVREALKTLLQRFEEHEYNPTPIVDLGVMVAQADGRLDVAESMALTSVVGRLLGTEMSVEVAELLFGASAEVLEMAGFESRARLLAEVLRDCDAVEPAFIVAIELALSAERSPDSLRVLADAKASAPKRRLRDAERQVLEKLADATRLPRARLDALVAKALAEKESPPAASEA
jgi:hypothetical protein